MLSGIMAQAFGVYYAIDKALAYSLNQPKPTPYNHHHAHDPQGCDTGLQQRLGPIFHPSLQAGEDELTQAPLLQLSHGRESMRGFRV